MKDNKLCAAIAQNPVMVLFLGACPALGATSAVLPALTLGAAALAVMVLASLAASLLRNAVSTRVKPLTNFILVAGFAAIVQLLMHAWFPAQFNALGVYTTLLAVDLLVYPETERASDRPVGAALADSLLTGLGFALALVVTALIRELFGTGTVAGAAVPFFKAHAVSLLTSAAGGFFVFAIVMALVQAIFKNRTEDLSGVAADAAATCAEKEA